MSSGRYREKSVGVQAFQFDTGPYARSFPPWLHEKLLDGTVLVIPKTSVAEPQLRFTDKNDENVSVATSGNWLVRYEGGEIRILSDREFRTNFEEIK